MDTILTIIMTVLFGAFAIAAFLIANEKDK